MALLSFLTFVTMHLSLKKYILTILIACVFTIILQQKVSRLYYRAYIAAPRVVYPVASNAHIVDLSKYYNGSMDIQEGNYVEAIRFIQNVHEKIGNKSKEENGGGSRALTDDKSTEVSDAGLSVVNGTETTESDDKHNHKNMNLENIVEKAIDVLKNDDKNPLKDINTHHMDLKQEVSNSVLTENSDKGNVKEQNLPLKTDDNLTDTVQVVPYETQHGDDSKPKGPVDKINVSVSQNSEQTKILKVGKKRLSELEKMVIGKSPSEIDKMYRDMLKCRKLPDVLIIGFEKCGTVTLKSYLSIHPQIYQVGLLLNYQLFNRDSKTTVEQYTKNKPCTPNGKLRLEKLATWGTVAKTAAVVPNAKLIAIVKEPVERSMSHYVHRTTKGIESTKYNFDTMIASIMDYGKPIPIKTSVLFRQSKYIERLEPWIESYGLDNIHLVDGDNFVKNPASELQAVENFLGLKPYITNDNFVYNPVKKFYCLKQNGDDACMTSDKGRPHPEMLNTTRTRLQEYYKPYNERLFSTIGRKFPWNY